MEPMRFGIVGCGGIAGFHAQSLQVLAGEGLGFLVAGAEVNDARAKAFGEKWGVEIYPSLGEMLAKAQVDAVAVCTPSGLHGDESIQIARAGKHVLSEKPGDVVAKKVKKAIEVAAEKGVVFGGIFQQRFNPGPLKVKKAVEEGYFGHITFVHCETPWLREQGYYDSDTWRGTWALDGGVLSNQAPHMIDRMLWLGGDVDEVLSATCETRDRNIEAETVAVATVRLVDGAIGSITGTTLAYPGLPQRVLICGSEGSAAFVGDELVSFATKRPFEYEPPADMLPIPVNAEPDGKNTAANPLAMQSIHHTANYRNFIRSVRAGVKPLVTGEDQYRVSRVLNLIYEKAGVGLFAKG